ncbi:hypothetical protein ACWOAH_04420 [Vagococcus vulneris]|uniref:Uncharacterized protein n=1 Tax=Vagococcus vulneris TaxID=1977869 RepID=A0A430A0B0_9ENTE|nr:hypothetical protein [Vagococcus vulneris]RST99776.1 hypothetical protein CBF37_03365 [Vagococcus vulneris]
MRKFIRIITFFISVIIIGISIGVTIGYADDEKDKPLITDLHYDKERKVITGKTAPNANVWLDNVAGAIVANDKGEFEFPVPADPKLSTISVLDAEGDASTHVRYNFEKNTVETGEASEESTETTESTSSSNENKIDETSGMASSTPASSSASESTSDSYVKVTEESYKRPTEPKRSLIWLWTLLVIVVITIMLIGGYLWYKRKLKKEEELERRKASKKSSHKKSSKRVKENRSAEKVYTSASRLDDLIDSELESGSTKKTSNKSSGRKKNRTKRK